MRENKSHNVLFQGTFDWENLDRYLLRNRQNFQRPRLMLAQALPKALLKSLGRIKAIGIFPGLEIKDISKVNPDY